MHGGAGVDTGVSGRWDPSMGALVVPLVVALIASVGIPFGARPAAAQESGDDPSLTDCIKNPASKALYGPTDINAQSANQGLSVGFNDDGTVTVLRWPSPSYYDQVRYTTESPDQPNLGVAPNEGAFLGLALTTDDGRRHTTWLRDWETTQRYAEGLTDETITRHRNRDLGLEVTVRDVVTHPDDILSRRVTVERAADSPVSSARLVAYENLSLVVSKIPEFPVQDWCYESQNTDRATYDADADAIVHDKSGTDSSTGEPSSVAIAMGFGSDSTGHQVGVDAQAQPNAPPERTDAFADADDGELAGNDRIEGQTTGALATDLDLDEGTATETLYLTGGEDPSAARDTLAAARDAGHDELANAKADWLEDTLAEAPMPANDAEAIRSLVRRALVTLVTDIDRESGAIVASIATQSPYGEDWPRDGAFFDYTLDLIGRHDWVKRHHRFYADTQRTSDDPTPAMSDVPVGNWAMNYYADGVVGGPIPWEIDETGYTLWNYWAHYEATEDREALRSVYASIEPAADFLTGCGDEANGLQCPALEDDNLGERQTIVGAQTVWLGLDSAARAARTLGETADADRWAARRDELGAAIDDELWTGQAYGEGASAPLVWPVCFRDYGSERMTSHNQVLWDRLTDSFAEPAPGGKDSGLYESKGLVSLAKAWKDDPGRMADVRSGLDWVATEHATTDTHVMGEVWQQDGDEVTTTVSQPHAWEQVLFYLAALEAWPPESVADAGAGCGGSLAALRSSSGAGGAGDATGDQAASTATAAQTSDNGAWVIAGVVIAVLVIALAATMIVRRRRSAGAGGAA